MFLNAIRLAYHIVMPQIGCMRGMC